MILYISHQLGNKERRKEILEALPLIFGYCVWGFIFWGGGGGVEFFVETLSSDQKRENINVVTLGVDSGGIEVDEYALFISNVISIQYLEAYPIDLYISCLTISRKLK